MDSKAIVFVVVGLLVGIGVGAGVGYAAFSDTDDGEKYSFYRTSVPMTRETGGTAPRDRTPWMDLTKP